MSLHKRKRTKAERPLYLLHLQLQMRRRKYGVRVIPSRIFLRSRITPLLLPLPCQTAPDPVLGTFPSRAPTPRQLLPSRCPCRGGPTPRAMTKTSWFPRYSHYFVYTSLIDYYHQRPSLLPLELAMPFLNPLAQEIPSSIVGVKSTECHRPPQRVGHGLISEATHELKGRAKYASLYDLSCSR